MFSVTVKPMYTWLSDYAAKVRTFRRTKGE